MVDQETKFIIITYCACITAMVAFASYACIIYTMWLLKHKHDQTQEEFNTARGSQSAWRITWSFFAGAVGCWVLVSPAQFGVYSGILALCIYALASGLPLLLIAYFGGIVQQMHPDCLSFADFVGKRFGPTFKVWCVAVVLFNMAIAMLAELTTVGTLFKIYLGSVNYGIIITVVVLTMTYTCYGGLRISIITDQLQSLLAITLLGILVVYVAVTFRHTLDDSLIEPGTYLGPNEYGYSAIFSMPCSLIASTVFSEAVWQKVWASQSRRSLLIAGACSSAAVTVVVFLFGFGGWLAAWAGLIDLQNTDYNLFFFQVLGGAANVVDGYAYDPENANPRVVSWIGVVTLVCAVTMNEGAVDSLQNGITASISAHFLRGQHIFWARLTVLLINIPIIIVALKNYNVLSLFLVANMLTSCCFLPVILGLWDTTRRWVSETAALFGCVFAMCSITAYGAIQFKDISYGAWYAWYGDTSYWYYYFLCACISSLVGVALWTGAALLVKLVFKWDGPGISGVLGMIPGYQYVTGEYESGDWLVQPWLQWLGKLLRHQPSIDAANGVVPQPSSKEDSIDAAVKPPLLEPSVVIRQDADGPRVVAYGQ